MATSLQMTVSAGAGALFGLIDGDRLVAMTSVMIPFALAALGFYRVSVERVQTLGV